MDTRVNQTHEGIAIGGYDPVAYFADGTPTMGIADYAFTWNGAVWRFASAQHRDLFAAHPESYAPQFGGQCAFAISLGKSAPGSPAHWRIVDGRLYLALNPVANLLARIIPGRLAAAHRHWGTR